MKMLINGKYTDASDGAVIEVFDPAAHELRGDASANGHR